VFAAYIRMGVESLDAATACKYLFLDAMFHFRII
jgi:hypothetical protein